MPLISLRDDDREIDSVSTTYNTEVTDAASDWRGKVLGQQRSFDLCYERRDLNKRRYEAEVKYTGKLKRGLRRP